MQPLREGRREGQSRHDPVAVEGTGVEYASYVHRITYNKAMSPYIADATYQQVGQWPHQISYERAEKSQGSHEPARYTLPTFRQDSNAKSLQSLAQPSFSELTKNIAIACK